MGFYEYKAALIANKKWSPDEEGHEQADKLLCQIALSASRGELNEDETGELIKLYNSIDKWYA